MALFCVLSKQKCVSFLPLHVGTRNVGLCINKQVRGKQTSGINSWYNQYTDNQSTDVQRRKKRMAQMVQILQVPKKPTYDWNYLIKNTDKIRKNIQNRKSNGNIDLLCSLWNKIEDPNFVDVDSYFSSREFDLNKFTKELYEIAGEIPNTTHPDVPIGNEDKNKLVEICGTKKDFHFKPKSIVDIGEHLNMLRVKDLGYFTEQKSYYFTDGFAELERALIKYTLKFLKQKNFQLILVPDLIHPTVIHGCGFNPVGPKTQIYHLDPKKHGTMCLAGTGEMSLAAYFINAKLYEEELPKKICTISRCYRAEVDDKFKGIYRVHQFYKVEMFCVTSNESGRESDDLLKELVKIQKELYTSLGLHYRILDMASEELGDPANRKYDMEAWMPHEEFWGEISSASNCTDYQSRRLNIQYMRDNGQLNYAHTVNGTGCALPRVMMAIIEQNQTMGFKISLPEVLHPYMNGREVFDQPTNSHCIHYNKTKNIDYR